MERRGHCLVISQRSWLVTALKDILEGITLDVVNIRTSGEALAHVRTESPAIVLVDHSVGPESGVPGFCRQLIQDGLSQSVPMLVYSSGTFSRADRHAQALDAGAWAIVRDPLEAAPLVSLIRRLLRVSDLISLSKTQEETIDPETGFLTLSGLRRVLPALGALAVRNRAPMTFVVLAPTAEDDHDIRGQTAELCLGEVRNADLCAWVNDLELAIVTYDTPAEGARQLVARLNEAARGVMSGDEGVALSAGIVELGPREQLHEAVAASRRGTPEEDGLPDTEFRDLFSLSAAQGALEEARRAGGGVRVASTS